MNRGMINFVVAFVAAVVLSALVLLASIKIMAALGMSFYAYKEYMGFMTLGLTYFIRQVL